MGWHITHPTVVLQMESFLGSPVSKCMWFIFGEERGKREGNHYKNVLDKIYSCASGLNVI